MTRFLSLYARLVATIGTILLVAALIIDPRWINQAAAVLAVTLVTMALRTFQIPLTKYSALNLLGMVAAGGAIIIGAPATALDRHARSRP